MVRESRTSWRSALKRISSSGMRTLLGGGAPPQRRQAATSAWHRSFEKAACGTELLWLRILRSKTASTAAPSRGPSLERPSTRSGRSDRWAPSRVEGLSRLGPRERSEEHTSELQSQSNLVCRLLLEKKKVLFPSDRKTTRPDSSHHQSQSAVFGWTAYGWRSHTSRLSQLMRLMYSLLDLIEHDRRL